MNELGVVVNTNTGEPLENLPKYITLPPLDCMRWIPLVERLPDVDGTKTYVLTHFIDTRIKILVRGDLVKDAINASKCTVTHWTRLIPDPVESVEGE